MKRKSMNIKHKNNTNNRRFSVMKVRTIEKFNKQRYSCLNTIFRYPHHVYKVQNGALKK